MPHIVINTDSGDIFLSPASIIRYAELLNKSVFFYDSHNLIRKSHKLAGPNDLVLFAYLGEQATNEDIFQLKSEYWLDLYNVARDQPQLVQLVWELTQENNPDVKNLKVVKMLDWNELVYSSVGGRKEATRRESRGLKINSMCLN